jgi:hypothetical protein
MLRRINSQSIKNGSIELQDLSYSINKHSNVKNFGVVGDGVTDNRNAVIVAAAATITNPDMNQTLFFPAGTYVFSEGINIFHNGITQNVSRISGEAGTKFVLRGGKGGFFIYEVEQPENF